ncbi:MAG TPA: hypothetical protein VF020_05330, partial [Chthoniobacterales bacterium]
VLRALLRRFRTPAPTPATNQAGTKASPRRARPKQEAGMAIPAAYGFKVAFLPEYTVEFSALVDSSSHKDTKSKFAVNDLIVRKT